MVIDGYTVDCLNTFIGYRWNSYNTIRQNICNLYDYWVNENVVYNRDFFIQFKETCTPVPVYLSIVKEIKLHK